MDEDRFEFLKSLKEMGKEMSELGLTFTTSEECLGMPKRVALIPNGFEVGVDELTLRPYIQATLKLPRKKIASSNYDTWNFFH